LIAGKFNDCFTNTGPGIDNGNPMLLKGPRIICVDLIKKISMLLAPVNIDEIKQKYLK